MGEEKDLRSQPRRKEMEKKMGGIFPPTYLALLLNEEKSIPNDLVLSVVRTHWLTFSRTAESRTTPVKTSLSGGQRPYLQIRLKYNHPQFHRAKFANGDGEIRLDNPRS